MLSINGEGMKRMASNSEFMHFMGYRNMILEEKIEECLAAAARGENEITLDCGDLTDEEVEYITGEVYRRLSC